MNVDPGVEQMISPTLFEGPDMRRALARRDIASVYRRLQSAGVSQRRIATLTGQSPSEVYEVLRGRQVQAYDVLARISDGLGVPRGYMGLAYDDSTRAALVASGSADEVVGPRSMAASCSADQEERDDVRRLLGHAAEVTMGAAVSDVARWWRPLGGPVCPVPARVGLSDVVRVEEVTQVFRALDYRFGGGACMDAVVAQAMWVQRLLASCGDDAGARLHVALADLHNLAGWTAFDVGLHSTAKKYFSRALEQARYAENATLVANILYRLGRLHLHRAWLREGLKFFQLGQIAAQDSGCEVTVAMLCANEAWAYALMGESGQALRSIGRASDELSRADREVAPRWVRFFGPEDLGALIGMVHLALAESASPDGRGHLDRAVAQLEASIRARGPDMSRSITFELTGLATAQLGVGDADNGIATGSRALDIAERVRSVRVVDRLTPLRRSLDLHRRGSEGQDLVERIGALQAV